MQLTGIEYTVQANGKENAVTEYPQGLKNNLYFKFTKIKTLKIA